MRRIQITGIALIILLALSLTVAGSASAKAKRESVVQIHDRGELPPGKEASIEGTFPLPGSAGTVNCYGSVNGAVTTNWEHVDTVTFTDASLGLAGATASCEGASVEATGFPWTLDLGVGHASLRGVKLTIEGCTYSSKKLHGKATKNSELYIALEGEFTSTGCGVKAFGISTSALQASTTRSLTGEEGSEGKHPIFADIFTRLQG